LSMTSGPCFRSPAGIKTSNFDLSIDISLAAPRW
jgi:hypothetical protein